MRPAHTGKVGRRTAIAAVACVVATIGLARTSAVHAAPDSQRACFNNGWKTLKTVGGGSFKNQGACVSFAAQGGEFATSLPSGGGVE